ncbi:MAG TPA: alkaline phosphatase family protein [Gaiellaceae bacterium]|nr:alkaline phosphatase family protein [Gaiellaceae bacterium]
MRSLLVAAVASIGVVASAGAEAAGAPRVPRLERIVVVVFENKDYDEVIGAESAPTFNLMARRHALLRGYYAVAHPSLPNYLALVSGSTHGLTENCTECVFDARNLADTIEASGRTWKAYLQGLPLRGYTGARWGRYVKRHNPFPYFRSVVYRPARLRRMVPLYEFRRDLERKRLPDFSFVVPDLCSGMHDCPVATGDRWLKQFLTPLLSSPQLEGGVVFVTFDEASDRDVRGGGGRIATLALGPTVRPAAASSRGMNHYGLLRTIEDGWGLPRLGRSATANAVTGIWRD